MFFNTSQAADSLSQECCSLGEQSAKNLTDEKCRNLFLTETPKEHHVVDDCWRSFEACCQKEQESKACSLGIAAARVPGTTTNECYNHTKATDRSSRYWQVYGECCTACQAGVDTANKTMACGKNSDLGPLYDATFQICCDTTIALKIKMTPTDRCKTDINPCSQRCQDPGPTHHLRCLCNVGYLLDKDGHSCKDENECELNPFICGQFDTCINTLGSFYCRTLNMGQNWENDRVVKKPSAVTTTTPSSSPDEVACPDGYEYDSESRDFCTDTNECLDGSFDCPVEKPYCQNILGSYVCLAEEQEGRNVAFSTPDSNLRTDTSSRNLSDTCIEGYSKQQGKCLDVDECLKGTHRCNSNERCDNYVGGYRCILRDVEIDNTKKLEQSNLDIPRVRHPGITTVAPYYTSSTLPYAISISSTSSKLNCYVLSILPMLLIIKLLELF